MSLVKLDRKKGMSEVVSTVILIGITISVVAIVWVVTRNLVEDNIHSSESCFGIFDKFSLDSRYTCYNNTAATDEIWFSVNVGDLETIEDILVGISGPGSSVSFKIKADNPAELEYFNRTKPAPPLNMSIPGKNQGLTYIYTLPPTFTQAPQKVEIALVIDGELCRDTSTITQFDSCSSLV